MESWCWKATPVFTVQPKREYNHLLIMEANKDKQNNI